MFFPRNILAALQDHASTKQVTVLTGMRRTGKTTLLKHLLETSSISQKVFFDLERLDYRDLFVEKNYETIGYALTQQGIELSQPLLIGMDEIQLVPNLPSVIKYFYDTYQVKFILTGSSSYYLKNRFTESLAGRKKIFEIYPLSFGEWLDFKGIPHQKGIDFKTKPYLTSEYERLKVYYNEFIDYGGFPEVVLSNRLQDKRDLIQDILSSYIHYDIASISDFKMTTEAYKLIKLLAIRVGTKLEISKLSILTGLSRNTIENYIELFEQSYLIKTIPVTSYSPDREIVKAKKLYFLDNGIAAMSSELGSGAKFENAVFNQLRNYGEISYYALKTGHEIDFILDKTHAFEVKETATSHDRRNATNIAQKIQIPSSNTFVIGRHPEQVFDGFIWGGNIL